MTTEPKLPAGVWRDDSEAGQKFCPLLAVAGYDEPICMGSKCAWCYEYQGMTIEVLPREPMPESPLGMVWYSRMPIARPVPDPAQNGYYCSKAGRP